MTQWRNKLAEQGKKRKPEPRTSGGNSIYKEWKEVILNALADRDGWACWVCSTVLTLATASPDHVISPLEGGAHTLANLKMICRGCNNRRGIEVRRRRHGY